MKQNYLKALRIFLKKEYIKLNQASPIKLNFDKAPTPTSTAGFRLEVLNFSNRYGLDFWHDEFTNTGTPKLCLALWSINYKLIDRVLQLVDEYYLGGHDTKLVKEGRNYKLKTPLPSKYFGHFVLEPYEQNYLTYYFKKEISLSNFKDKDFLSVILNELDYIIEVINSINQPDYNPNSDYPQIENRIIVRQHKIIRSD